MLGRRFRQAVLRQLDIDGMYLTRAQALTLHSAVSRLYSVAPLPHPLTNAEMDVISRLQQRAFELQRYKKETTHA